MPPLRGLGLNRGIFVGTALRGRVAAFDCFPFAFPDFCDLKDFGREEYSRKIYNL